MVSDSQKTNRYDIEYDFYLDEIKQSYDTFDSAEATDKQL